MQVFHHRYEVFCSTDPRWGCPTFLENGFKFSNKIRPPIVMLPSAHLSASFRKGIPSHHLNAISLGERGRPLGGFQLNNVVVGKYFYIHKYP